MVKYTGRCCSRVQVQVLVLMQVLVPVLMLMSERAMRVDECCMCWSVPVLVPSDQAGASAEC